MHTATHKDITRLSLPKPDSHKGQNGKLLVIGGSHFFHAASVWALTVASRIVDLVHYASVPENNTLVQTAKNEFRNGIVIPRSDIEDYIMEDDCILIGPGMVRKSITNSKPALPAGRYHISNKKIQYDNIKDIEKIPDEGEQTAAITNYLLGKYPHKQWVIDAGALQMLDLSDIPRNAILTPHRREFEMLWNKYQQSNSTYDENDVARFAKKHSCIVLLKGQEDIMCDMDGVCRIVKGGNAGMTKGGTGDVLAGLVAALACTNNPQSAALAGSYINKKAGEALYDEVGPYFNATDLANQIPKTMRKLLY